PPLYGPAPRPPPFERVTVQDVERRRPRVPSPETPPGPPEAPSPAVTRAPVTASPSPPAERTVPPAAAPSSAVPDGAIGPPAPAVAGAPAKGRILVIDDEGAIREMARDILESGGYEVVTVVDGVDALEVCGEGWGRVGVETVDMVMPRM